MLHNPYRAFLALIPADPLLVGDVVAVTGGVAIVQLPGGAQLQARGDAAVGQRVFVQGGAIQGPAPSLTYVEGEA
ncbi:hypothetical protein QRO08_03825 [Paracidovorax citrulli]|uniref:Uncharacterized protein n=2 Tax=Paracidovorax citrulli TaxID=80869 RepID=A1TR63_PARC0|nr:hypothetical protein [Paracidovorax citrulli]ABM33451.1 conserved hypothetical protein [Paracidovorax citrulli AAC00-1]ABM34633.1 conserved hypothetical protein [Paracidovorax citrulli AAC00-1]ATG92640.1 hypothetical protein CQB05_00070 [Paracidovorax citrulli]ATG94075.1 hypothetical protein CQB05_08580 [Paracidovorax citrulli]MVT28111.1 hypothetical protein [Paracidovorax citrulli]